MEGGGEGGRGKGGKFRKEEGVLGEWTHSVVKLGEKRRIIIHGLIGGLGWVKEGKENMEKGFISKYPCFPFISLNIPVSLLSL